MLLQNPTILKVIIAICVVAVIVLISFYFSDLTKWKFLLSSLVLVVVGLFSGYQLNKITKHQFLNQTLGSYEGGKKPIDTIMNVPIRRGHTYISHDNIDEDSQDAVPIEIDELNDAPVEINGSNEGIWTGSSESNDDSTKSHMYGMNGGDPIIKTEFNDLLQEDPAHVFDPNRHMNTDDYGTNKERIMEKADNIIYSRVGINQPKTQLKSRIDAEVESEVESANESEVESEAEPVVESANESIVKSSKKKRRKKRKKKKTKKKKRRN